MKLCFFGIAGSTLLYSSHCKTIAAGRRRKLRTGQAVTNGRLRRADYNFRRIPVVDRPLDRRTRRTFPPCANTNSAPTISEIL